MKLDYIEIGTSDFDTLLQSSDLVGISIDPLEIYLDRLPNKPNNKKLNVAISDFDGKCEVFYIDPDDISTYKLPDWLRGCNSIQKEHPAALTELKKRGLLYLYKQKTIDVLSWDTLVRSNNIVSIDYLKIDTEGHDHVIINSILKSSTNIVPKKINFETNALTPKETIIETLKALNERGYITVEHTDENTIVELSESVVTKIIFSTDTNPDFADFWDINSKVCSKKLKVTPVLFYICDEESDFYWDSYGLVKKVKAVGENTGMQSQIFRMYGTKYFMDELCMTNDIDMLLFSKEVVTNKLFDKKSITIHGSDAYDPKRPECVGVYAGPDRYTICYIVATGEIFDKILNTNVSFAEYTERLLTLQAGFDSDEIYFGRMVNKTNITVNKIERGYSSSFYLADRIEKMDFVNKPETFKINLNGYINIEKFIDCHCARPYIKYKEQIDKLVDLILKDSE